MITTLRRLAPGCAAELRPEPADHPRDHVAEEPAPPRCEICGWPLRASLEEGCIPGNCSYRPDNENERARIRRRYEEIAARRAPAPEMAVTTGATEPRVDVGIFWPASDDGPSPGKAETAREKWRAQVPPEPEIEPAIGDTPGESGSL